MTKKTNKSAASSAPQGVTQAAPYGTDERAVYPNQDPGYIIHDGVEIPNQDPHYAGMSRRADAAATLVLLLQSIGPMLPPQVLLSVVTNMLELRGMYKCANELRSSSADNSVVTVSNSPNTGRLAIEIINKKKTQAGYMCNDGPSVNWGGYNASENTCAVAPAPASYIDVDLKAKLKQTRQDLVDIGFPGLYASNVNYVDDIMSRLIERLLMGTQSA